MTKELVELHHGSITVESEVGKGTSLTILFSLGKEHLDEEEIVCISNDSSQLTVDSINSSSADQISEIYLEHDDYHRSYSIQQHGSDSKPIILLVEDNFDLRNYILGYLADSYTVIEANNGMDGLKMATESVPDLIISDVMMPRMDGYELCENIKTDERTSHIPVILLTARASMESKLKGLETGADDFITKPFDPQELLARIRNLIEQRKKLQERLMKNIRKLGIEHLMEIETDELTSMDQKFLQKVIIYILEHISDPELSIETLAAKMALSRRQLHRKLVSITGNPPIKFIRSIKLNRAAELLAIKTGDVTEIAYEVGFNNLSWFAKSFKEQFGVLPSEYLKENPGK